MRALHPGHRVVQHAQHGGGGGAAAAAAALGTALGAALLREQVQAKPLRGLHLRRVGTRGQASQVAQVLHRPGSLGTCTGTAASKAASPAAAAAPRRHTLRTADSSMS